MVPEYYNSDTAFLIVPALILLIAQIGTFLGSGSAALPQKERNQLRWLSIYLIPFVLFMGCSFIALTFIGGLPMYAPENAGSYLVGDHGIFVEVSFPIYVFSWLLNIIIIASVPIGLLILLLGLPYLCYGAEISKKEGLRREESDFEAAPTGLSCFE